MMFVGSDGMCSDDYCHIRLLGEEVPESFCQLILEDEGARVEVVRIMAWGEKSVRCEWDKKR